jgi:hypothetical protein
VALTDQDIRQMFMVEDGEVRWAEISVIGLPAIFRKEAEKHNRKAGYAVAFWNGSNGQKLVTVAGNQVTEGRILNVLQRPAPEARRVEAKPAMSTKEANEERARKRRMAVIEKGKAANDKKRAAGWTQDVTGMWHKPKEGAKA